VAQLYPQALGSLFVASYDSQGCGGAMRSPNISNHILGKYIFIIRAYGKMWPLNGQSWAALFYVQDGDIYVDVTLHSQWLWVDINTGKICSATRGKCNSQ
jgi:hypothetical protein